MQIGVAEIYAAKTPAWYQIKDLEILGVPESSEESQIRSAYFRLAKEYHPDVSNHPKSEQMFHQLNSAYEQMINRKANPQYNPQPNPNKQEQSYNQYQQYTYEQDRKHKKKKRQYATDQDIIQEMLRQMNEQINRQQKQRERRFYKQPLHYKGYIIIEDDQQEKVKKNSSLSTKERKKLDIHKRIQITINQAKNGGKKILQFKRKQKCKKCKNEHKDKKQNRCKKCKGWGFVQKSHTNKTCSACNGRGSQNFCRECKGNGQIYSQVEENIYFEAGAQNLDQIMIKGKGHQHLKIKGDLYVRLYVLEPQGLQREGNDTFQKMIISVSDAALGCNIVYKTVWGERVMKIKPGTQDGFRIKKVGEGYHSKGCGHGDHFIDICIDIPTQLDEEEEAIYQKLKIIQDQQNKQ